MFANLCCGTLATSPATTFAFGYPPITPNNLSYYHDYQRQTPPQPRAVHDKTYARTNTIPITLIFERDARRVAAVGLASSLGCRSVKVTVGLPCAALGFGDGGGSWSTGSRTVIW